jgi:4-amino-4-deoxy-L-arabinose transferase-like glycosyltransferase
MIDNRVRSSATAAETQLNGLSERRWSWFLCLVCLVMLFSSLGSAALFDPDEGRNAEKAREILLLSDWVTPHQNFLPTLDKPILFYWFVALCFKLFGISEWSARLPSALAALGCVFLVYRFAKRRWGLRAALWSCLVLITSAEFFVLARLVIFDMTVTFFITLALFSFYNATLTSDPRSARLHCFLMYAAMGVGTLVKGLIALVIPGMVIFFYLLLTGKWVFLRRMDIMRGVVVYSAVVAPWYLSVEARNPGYLHYFFWEEHFVRYLTPHFNRSKTWYYFFAVLGIGFLPWTLFLPVAVRNLWKRAFDDANVFLGLWVILTFAFFSASNSKMPHYILPIYPPLALLTGSAMAVKFENPATKPWRILYGTWIVTLGCILYFLIGAAWPNLLPTQIRSAVPQKISLVAAYGAMIFLIWGIFLVGYFKNIWKDRGMIYLCTSISLALFWVIVGQLMAAASFHRTAKLLAEQSVPLINREDRLVFYDTYLEGTLFYLRIDQPIWLVQAREKKEVMGSFYVGERHPAPAAGYDQVLFTFEEFAARWKKNELPLRVFVKEKNLARFRRAVETPPRILMKFNDHLLVTNS